MFFIMSTVRYYLACLLKRFVNFLRLPDQTQSLYEDKDKNNDSRFTFYFHHSKKQTDSHSSSNTDLGPIHI